MTVHCVHCGLLRGLVAVLYKRMGCNELELGGTITFFIIMRFPTAKFIYMIFCMKNFNLKKKNPEKERRNLVDCDIIKY